MRWVSACTWCQRYLPFCSVRRRFPSSTAHEKIKEEEGVEHELKHHVAEAEQQSAFERVTHALEGCFLVGTLIFIAKCTDQELNRAKEDRRVL